MKKENKMSKTINENIPELKIEFIDDGIGQGLISLEQDGCGNQDCVAIHPIHLRYMAEQFGLIEACDQQSQKTIAMLTRRLLCLRDRVDHLANRLMTHSGIENSDMFYNQTYARATADVALEFCVDLDIGIPK
ncbi:MAG: hypothetical protein Q7T57_01650 [Dehalococcoidales bacterium]|nr:hypothetical protein [Dehalococcoidales bacterium]